MTNEERSGLCSQRKERQAAAPICGSAAGPPETLALGAAGPCPAEFPWALVVWGDTEELAYLRADPARRLVDALEANGFRLLARNCPLAQGGGCAGEMTWPECEGSA